MAEFKWVHLYFLVLLILSLLGFCSANRVLLTDKDDHKTKEKLDGLGVQERIGAGSQGGGSLNFGGIPGLGIPGFSIGGSGGIGFFPGFGIGGGQGTPGSRTGPNPAPATGGGNWPGSDGTGGCGSGPNTGIIGGGSPGIGFGSGTGTSGGGANGGQHLYCTPMHCPNGGCDGIGLYLDFLNINSQGTQQNVPINGEINGRSSSAQKLNKSTEGSKGNDDAENDHQEEQILAARDGT